MVEVVTATLPPLTGDFHAAAVLDDGPIDGLSDENFATVLKAKSLGAWNLHQATKMLELSHFVLFSSIGSLVGSPGQATYVAANTFLDALAQFRRGRGQAAISINWGALSEVGMAARHREIADYLERVGFNAFSPEIALGVMGVLLDANPVVIGAAAMDWATLSSFYPAWSRSPRNGEVFSKTEKLLSAAVGWQWHEILASQSQEQQAESVDEALSTTVAIVLQMPPNLIEYSQSLLSMGMDSIMAIELQIQIETVFGVKVSTLELMRGTNLGELSGHLLRMLTDSSGATSAGQSPAASGGTGASSDSILPIPKIQTSMTSIDILLRKTDVSTLDQAILTLDEAEVERAIVLLSTIERGEQ